MILYRKLNLFMTRALPDYQHHKKVLYHLHTFNFNALLNIYYIICIDIEKRWAKHTSLRHPWEKSYMLKQEFPEHAFCFQFLIYDRGRCKTCPWKLLVMTRFAELRQCSTHVESRHRWTLDVCEHLWLWRPLVVPEARTRIPIHGTSSLGTKAFFSNFNHFLTISVLARSRAI